jgi:hypothetical protein
MQLFRWQDDGRTWKETVVDCSRYHSCIFLKTMNTSVMTIGVPAEIRRIQDENVTTRKICSVEFIPD